MSKNKINERLTNIQKAKEEISANDSKELVNKLVHQSEEPIDMNAIAEELMQRNSEEAIGANDGYTKDTLYIENSIYAAFNALCLRRGDKKRFANEALRDFVLKKYEQIRKGIDN